MSDQALIPLKLEAPSFRAEKFTLTGRDGDKPITAGRVVKAIEEWNKMK